jgi:hypothetical protein
MQDYHDSLPEQKLGMEDSLEDSQELADHSMEQEEQLGLI